MNGPMLSRSRVGVFDPYDETPPGAPHHGTRHGKRVSARCGDMVRRIKRRREGRAWRREQGGDDQS